MASSSPRSRKLWLSCMRTLQIIITVVLLLASTVVVVGRAEEPLSGGYRFELTHVDSNGGFSNHELMRRAFDRSRLRAATLLHGTTSTHAASDSAPSIRAPVRLITHAAEYFMEFYMGKPTHHPSYAVVDTGSNLIWIAEKQCHSSKTRSLLPCNSDMCTPHANCYCSMDGKTCQYRVRYGGNNETETTGFMYKDQLTFLVTVAANKLKTFPNVAIGCSTESHFGDPSINDGIVGLGRGAQSLPRQLNFGKFSYCLNSYSRPDLHGYLLFATVPDMATGARSGAAVATTGLRRNDKYDTWYFVDLQGISIDGTRLDITGLQSNGGTSGGNMFIDSGASFTHLEENAFNKVVEKVDQIMKDKQHSKLQVEDGSICYSSSSTAHPDKNMLPQMVLHFADSADMVLPWESYLWYDAKNSCLAILKSNLTGMSFLGNYQQQGIHMLFDTEKEELSFVPAADCSKV